MKLHIAILALTVLALPPGRGVVGAQTVALHRASLPAANAPAKAQAAETSPHRYFGILQAANGTELIVRLRNGRDLHVDASEAFSLTRVSEPLFPGKPTIVRGDFARGGVFRATSVQRASMHAASWGIDS